MKLIPKRRLLWLSAGLFLLLGAAKTADDFFEISKNLEIFNAAYREVNAHYVDELKPGDMMKKGIDAMLNTLDPYTNFFSEAQAEEALMDREGEYSGVGCQVEIRAQYPVITEVFGRTPFADADIRPGDIIRRINGRDVKGATGSIQGFGNVGTWSARILASMGAKIVAIGDHTGAIRNREGIDIDKAIAWTKAKGGIAGFDGGERLKDADVVLLEDVDVLVPAALGGVLTRDNARDVRARFIVEGANGPTTPEADAILQERGIVIVPDIYANAGGVTVSYFEWVQNLQHFHWSEEEVNEKLERKMVKGFETIWRVATEKKVSLRTAAFIVAIGRVGKARVLRGLS